MNQKDFCLNKNGVPTSMIAFLQWEFISTFRTTCKRVQVGTHKLHKQNQTCDRKLASFFLLIPPCYEICKTLV